MKIDDFVTFTITPPLRARWPSHVTSLEHFRTVAFDREIMRSTISIGWFPVDDPQRPWTSESFGLRLGLWLNIVPQCYRSLVTTHAIEVFDGVLKNDIHKPHHLDMYIDELRNELWNKLKPIMPWETE